MRKTRAHIPSVSGSARNSFRQSMKSVPIISKNFARARTVEWITPDPHAQTLSEPHGRGLVDCLVGKRTRSRHDALAGWLETDATYDFPRFMDMPRHDSNLAA